MTGWLIDPQASGQVDYTLTAGLLDRDDTVSTRCLIRLLTRRGEWLGDPQIGSRLHQIGIIKESRSRVEAAVFEALQPLIDDGSISDVTVADVRAEDQNGFLQISIDITEADGTQQQIGPIQFGPPTAPNELAGFDPVGPEPTEGARSATLSDQSAIYGLGSWGAFVYGRTGTKQRSGTGWLVGADGDLRLSALGLLIRDGTIVSRCRIRLMTRRGEWLGDPLLGSRLHTIQTTKNAARQLQDFTQEALQPMIDDGSIVSVEQTSIEVGEPDGILVAHVLVRAPDESVVSVGDIELEGTDG